MIRPISISLQDLALAIGSEKANHAYFTPEAEFDVQRESLLKGESMVAADKDVVGQFPKGKILRMKNIEVGTFAFVI